MLTGLLMVWGIAGTPAVAPLSETLRLVPYPRRVDPREGEFPLVTKLQVLITPGADNEFAAAQLVAELGRLGSTATVVPLQGPAGATQTLLLCPAGAAEFSWDHSPFSATSTEAYQLAVRPALVHVSAASTTGLFYGVQTLKQLLRANRTAGGALPAVEINDWPAIAWRGWQDDLTRGPSTRLEHLKAQIALAAELKCNFWTYYMEYQFAYASHPDIGPPDGSLTAAELTELVAYARPLHIEVIGCQQSFGHFEHILSKDKYKHLAENSDVVSPATEETYRFLGELYDDQLQALTCPLFNACCDEVGGLGEGPARLLVEARGLGAVYADHLLRLHELLAQRGKRMLLWNDILLHHPEQLPRIPRDTIMLAWVYEALDQFDAHIQPMKDTGFEFFVCPGTSTWNRIVPDFAKGTKNIQILVRDGARYGALGVLNTSWCDSADTLKGFNLHGWAWGADVAWRGGDSDIARFNRAFGAAVFDEPSDHAGRAVELLSEAHAAGYDLSISRFYAPPEAGLFVIASERASMERLQEIAVRACTETAALRVSARANTLGAEELDFIAQRLRFVATRMLGLLDAHAFALAAYAADDVQSLRIARDILWRTANESDRLRDWYYNLYLRENKPYAVSWNTDRWDAATRELRAIVARLDRALLAFERGASPAEVDCWRLVEHGVRQTAPTSVSALPPADLPAGFPVAGGGIGFRVVAGEQASAQTLIELDLSAVLGERRLTPGLAAVQVFGASGPVTIGAQALADGHTIALLLPDLPAGATRDCLLLPAAPAQLALPALAVTQEGQDAVRMENCALNLVISAEGGHLNEWRLMGHSRFDLVMPGRDPWQCFGDLGPGLERTERCALSIQSTGPALARVRVEAPSGLHRTYTVLAGQPWVEVVLERMPPWFFNYTDPATLGREATQAVRYVFSNGVAGDVPSGASHEQWQTRQESVRWAYKHRADGLVLGMALPEAPCQLVIGPGGGFGDVGVDRPPAPAHVVLYAAFVGDGSPAQILEGLAHDLSFSRRPAITVFPVGGP